MPVERRPEAPASEVSASNGYGAIGWYAWWNTLCEDVSLHVFGTDLRREDEGAYENSVSNASSLEERSGVRGYEAENSSIPSSASSLENERNPSNHLDNNHLYVDAIAENLALEKKIFIPLSEVTADLPAYHRFCQEMADPNRPKDPNDPTFFTFWSNMSEAVNIICDFDRQLKAEENKPPQDKNLSLIQRLREIMEWHTRAIISLAKERATCRKEQAKDRSPECHSELLKAIKRIEKSLHARKCYLKGLKKETLTTQASVLESRDDILEQYGLALNGWISDRIVDPKTLSFLNVTNHDHLAELRHLVNMYAKTSEHEEFLRPWTELDDPKSIITIIDSGLKAFKDACEANGKLAQKGFSAETSHEIPQSVVGPLYGQQVESMVLSVLFSMHCTHATNPLEQIYLKQIALSFSFSSESIHHLSEAHKNLHSIPGEHDELLIYKFFILAHHFSNVAYLYNDALEQLYAQDVEKAERIAAQADQLYDQCISEAHDLKVKLNLTPVDWVEDDAIPDPDEAVPEVTDPVVIPESRNVVPIDSTIDSTIPDAVAHRVE